MIDAVFAQKDRAEWEEIFKAQDVWHQPVLSAAVSTTTLASGLHMSCILSLGLGCQRCAQRRCQSVTAGLGCHADARLASGLRMIMCSSRPSWAASVLPC